ncbi:hypothetical protein BU23DRAFT_565217 [Bimuria novae-zelandiae CBS 107.79]|uniref:Uncharacterized protein n=1 Tax=Bimuria novae-zelandiae CBS 107.79 TaxID=1447943 RepID=A0A6A5VHJ9_9PLEO|nr:hypothetical protein BU23DRAFT_565217 [Bimuria novae-zelandiae CBS 107.79]
MPHTKTTLPSTGVGKEGTGLKKTLKRWKEKWRTSSTPSSRTSSPRAPLSRLPSNASSAVPSCTTKPSLDPLPPIPASPPPVPSALFTPTTETFIHSPADPRNRSRNTSSSSTSSPPSTLRKPRPVSRRNTAPSDFLTSALYDSPRELPMNVVTTTIVAGNGDKPKRTSRLRLSISRRGSVLASSPSSPSLNGAFHVHERCSSRSTLRYEERSTSRAAHRISMVPESESRERVDSDRETLLEETELVKRKPRELANDRDIGTVELAYQYIGSRDGKKT